MLSYPVGPDKTCTFQIPEDYLTFILDVQRIILWARSTILVALTHSYQTILFVKGRGRNPQVYSRIVLASSVYIDTSTLITEGRDGRTSTESLSTQTLKTPGKRDG